MTGLGISVLEHLRQAPCPRCCRLG